MVETMLKEIGIDPRIETQERFNPSQRILAYIQTKTEVLIGGTRRRKYKRRTRVL